MGAWGLYQDVPNTHLNTHLDSRLSSDNLPDPVLIVYDSHWADPNADITFMSSQGTCYRISSWHLARHSAFFERFRKESPYPSTPIQTPLSNDLLDALCTKITLRPRSPEEVLQVSTPKLDDKIKLRTFYRVFEFHQALQAIESVVLEMVKRSFWPTLHGASYYDDPSLAMLALAGMEVKRMEQSDFWQQVTNLKPTWQKAFLIAVICRETVPGDGGLKFKTDPREIADAFYDEIVDRNEYSMITGSGVGEEVKGNGQGEEMREDRGIGIVTRVDAEQEEFNGEEEADEN